MSVCCSGQLQGKPYWPGSQEAGQYWLWASSFRVCISPWEPTWDPYQSRRPSHLVSPGDRSPGHCRSRAGYRVGMALDMHFSWISVAHACFLPHQSKVWISKVSPQKPPAHWTPSQPASGESKLHYALKSDPIAINNSDFEVAVSVNNITHIITRI